MVESRSAASLFPDWPQYGEREERQLLEVLHPRVWGVFSDDVGKVETFSRRFAAFQQARLGICVPNGTLGLELALRALGIGAGDDVITTPYTVIATAGAILTIGARPIFVDIDPSSYILDASKIESALTCRTKGGC